LSATDFVVLKQCLILQEVAASDYEIHISSCVQRAAKSPYVDDGSRLTVYRPHSLAAVSLLKLLQAHVEMSVVGVDVRGDR
jgi:hypothetical protein